MEIEWKIGEKDSMHQRRVTNGKTWTPAEDALLRELWPTGDGGEILNRLPSRSYGAIKKRAQDLGVRRDKKGGSVRLEDYFDIYMHDMQYAHEHQLDTVSKQPQWLRGGVRDRIDAERQSADDGKLALHEVSGQAFSDLATVVAHFAADIKDRGRVLDAAQ